MEDEDGYTTLNLQSRTPVSTYGHPVLPAPSPLWRPVAPILFSMCLVLFIALLSMVVMFFQASTSGVRDMPKRLREIRESLCLEGEEKNKNNGANCILCPVNWQWKGGDTCFYISSQKRSWAESKKFCSLQNSTLLMLKERNKLNFLPARDNFEEYWIGLHKSKENKWYWEDDSTLLVQKADWINLNWFSRCGSLKRQSIGNSDDCRTNHFCICEKAAVKL